MLIVLWLGAQHRPVLQHLSSEMCLLFCLAIVSGSTPPCRCHASSDLVCIGVRQCHVEVAF